jgi:hypothetical protein
VKRIILSLIVLVLFFSCEYHFINHPGRQFSTTKEIAIENGTFVAEYYPIYLNPNHLFNYDLKFCLAEYAHYHDGGFGGFEIDKDKIGLSFWFVNHDTTKKYSINNYKDDLINLVGQKCNELLKINIKKDLKNGVKLTVPLLLSSSKNGVKLTV